MEHKKNLYIIKRENGLIEYAKETFVVAESEVFSVLDTGEKEVDELTNQIAALLAQAETLKIQLSKREDTLKDFRTIKEIISENAAQMFETEISAKEEIKELE